ncbi:uncharacterized protein LOC129917821 [Episyrphus balteatus]|uniref:uncharacterized protein LOC129917821 n=1 Tax=Episyrphus balteatus TaxID=286459 RepID=UPI002485EEA7|nr:uncharacterized protein LOC129917821 [Episyrphus balteatus]
MKYLLAIALAFLMMITYFETCSATSEPVCGYENSQGKMIFLKYFRGINEGQSYKEVLPNGECIQVTCQSDYTLKKEKC